MTVDPGQFVEKTVPQWMTVDPASLHFNPATADQVGLDTAYQQTNGIFVVANTMYIAGTKSPRDVMDDLLIPFSQTQHSSRFQEAEKRLTPKITRVVGHSLGGSVALELAKKHSLSSEVYGTPVFSASESSTRHRHDWDPISIFDRGAVSTASPGWNPHSY